VKILSAGRYALVCIMAPAQLAQNARKRIRVLKETFAKLGGICQETDIKKVLELSIAIDDAIAIRPPDKSTVEPWLRAFLEAGIPSKLLELAVSIIRIAFPVSRPGSAAAPPRGPLLHAWKAAQYLLLQFPFQLASKPPPAKELAVEVLDSLVPTNQGGASKFLSDHRMLCFLFGPSLIGRLELCSLSKCLWGALGLLSCPASVLQLIVGLEHTERPCATDAIRDDVLKPQGDTAPHSGGHH
jgi:hypothetical protein